MESRSKAGLAPSSEGTTHLLDRLPPPDSAARLLSHSDQAYFASHRLSSDGENLMVQ